MKRYEDAWRVRLPPRMPVIVRVDGRAFHTWTRVNECERPFDARLVRAMNQVALALCQEMQGARLAYLQSDEVSVLLVDYATHESQAWFDSVLQKMASVAASVATSAFAFHGVPNFDKYEVPTFDARVFALPREEVTNYFLWRQNDWTRNSVRMLASSLYSHAKCDNKNNAELQEMCFQKGRNWNDLPTHLRRGRCAVHEEYTRVGVTRHRWTIDNEIPIFKSEGRQYVERLVEP